MKKQLKTVLDVLMAVIGGIALSILIMFFVKKTNNQLLLEETGTVLISKPSPESLRLLEKITKKEMEEEKRKNAQ
jgi:hypothetical protein